MKIKKFLIFLLSAFLVLCMCACGGKSSTDDNQSKTQQVTNTAPKFVVNVTDADGNAVEGVILQMYKDMRLTARSDIKGNASFNIYVTDGYKLSVFSCPDGYEYTGNSNILIKEGSTNYTLVIDKK